MNYITKCCSTLSKKGDEEGNPRNKYDYSHERNEWSGRSSKLLILQDRRKLFTLNSENEQVKFRFPFPPVLVTATL